MKYERKSFSVSPGAANISQENWERTFGKKPPAEETTTMVLKSDVNAWGEPRARAVSGVWVRTRDYQTPNDSDPKKPIRWTEILVLVEVEKKWRVIQTHNVPAIDMTISHITEVGGIDKAPEDML